MLTQQEQTAVRNIITREGGIDAVVDQIRQLSITDKKAAAIAAIGSAVSVTVTDWQAPAAYVAQMRFDKGETLGSIAQDITAAWIAKDQIRLGPLFVALHAAVKAKFNL